jgi:hypothetical protein|tara:strand:- start:13 stop:249 length:237 start_codon:yes stop_codon:yes gene_type:complete
MTKEYQTTITNYGEYDEDVSGDLVLVDAEKLDSLILGIGGAQLDFHEDDEDYKAPLNDLPEGKYYILRAINIEIKEVK